MAEKTTVVNAASVANSQSLLTWSVPAPLLEAKALEVTVSPVGELTAGLRSMAPLVGAVIEGVVIDGVTALVVTDQV